MPELQWFTYKKHIKACRFLKFVEDISNGNDILRNSSLHFSEFQNKLLS